jgi:hypothetical protein
LAEAELLLVTHRPSQVQSVASLELMLTMQLAAVVAVMAMQLKMHLACRVVVAAAAD